MTTQFVIDGRKPCSHCGLMLLVDQFSPNKRLHSGLSSWCRPCHRAATAEWKARTNYAERDRTRKR